MLKEIGRCCVKVEGRDVMLRHIEYYLLGDMLKGVYIQFSLRILNNIFRGVCHICICFFFVDN